MYEHLPYVPVPYLHLHFMCVYLFYARLIALFIAPHEQDQYQN